MTRVLTQGSDAFVVDASSGDTMRISRDMLADALASGSFLPASQKEVDKLQTQEKYGGTGGEIAAGAAGAARALTFGLSDPLIKATGLASAEELRLLRELNPTASGAGELAGTAASILIPGGPLGAVGKGAAKLGTRAAGTVARATGRAAESFVPALAGNVSREAAVGAAIGVGGGVSELALAPKEMTTSEQALTLLGHAGKGAAFGAAFGGAATGLGAASRYARSKMLVDVQGIAKLRSQKSQLTSELDSLRASAADPAKIAAAEENLTKVAMQLGQKQSHAIKRVATKAIAYGVGHAISGGVTGGLLGVIVAPKAFKTLSKALTPVAGNLQATWKSLREKIISGAETIERTAAKTASTAAPPLSEALQDALNHMTRAARGAQGLAEKVGITSRKLEQVADDASTAVLKNANTLSDLTAVKNQLGAEIKKRTIGLSESVQARAIASEIDAFVDRIATRLPKKITDKIVKAAGDISLSHAVKGAEIIGGAIGGGLGAVAQAAPELAIQGALHGGIHGALVGVGVHLGRKRLHRLTNVLTSKITPIGKAATLRGLQRGDIFSLVDDLKSEDVQELETSLRMSMPRGAPQVVTEPAVQQTMRALTYMVEQIGIDSSDGKIPHAKKTTKKMADKNKIERNIKAVIEPESVLQSFSEQKLTADQVQAWERVYPGALNELRTIVRAEIDRVSEGGQRFSRKQAEQIALLLGDRALAPRMYDPGVLRRMQISHKNNRDIKKTPPSSQGKKIHLSHLYRTTMQRIGDH